MNWFVECLKKLFLGDVWMKRKIGTVKGLFAQFYGQLKGLFGLFLCLVKGLFCGLLHATL